MLPRRYYREVARELSEINDPKAHAGACAINDLLDERARLAKRIIRAEGHSAAATKKNVAGAEQCTETAKSWIGKLMRRIL
jgi:hypothetical protein